MNTGSTNYQNPDKLAALSESLLKQGIAKTKLDADRMAEGMVGNAQNKRPSGQQFDFGFENEKRSAAKIDNYSGPATLPGEEYQTRPVAQINVELQAPTPNRFLDNVMIKEAIDDSIVGIENQHYDAFKTLHAKIANAEDEMKEQRNVIDNLREEITRLKQTHEVFHSRMEELHNKVSQEIPHQRPFVGDNSVAQLDTMMQQPIQNEQETRSEEADPRIASEVFREVAQVEARQPTADELIIQRQQEENPVPKQEVVDIDLGNIFSK